MQTHKLAGIHVAALTPLNPDYSPDLDAIPPLLDFYAEHGCHGALILGTTGEGPSFSSQERVAIWQSAVKIRETRPDFRLFAGTGTPSIEETNLLNRAAYSLGFDAVICLPPYYYRSAGESGLFEWFKEVINASVPSDGLLFGYNIPQITDVEMTHSLVGRLKYEFPKQFAGIKDSSGDLPFARNLVEEFGDGILVLVGNDRLLGNSLKAGCAGGITSGANLWSKNLRRIWDHHQKGDDPSILQAGINLARNILDDYPPSSSLLKALIPEMFSLPRWPVRPPLMELEDHIVKEALKKIRKLDL